MTRCSWVCLLALAACGVSDPVDAVVPDDGIVDAPGDRPSLDVDGLRSDSGVMAASADGDVLFVADVDNGAVLWVDRVTEEVQSFDVGGEPTRIVRAGRDIWVTLRLDGEVVRLQELNGSLAEVDRVTVGAEPYDVVISQDADVLFVSLSQEDAVVALDATTMEEVGRWSVPGEPRSLAVTPKGLAGGARLYVSTARSPVVTEIDPSAGVVATHAAPEARRFTDPRCDDRMMQVRLSGDLTVDAAGVVYAPALYADTKISLIDDAAVEPFPIDPGMSFPNFDTASGEFVPFDTGDFHETCPEEREPHTSPYGGSVDPTSPGKPNRFTPVLLKIDIPNGGQTEAMTLATPLGFDPGADVDIDFGPNGLPPGAFGGQVASGYPAQVTVSEVGERIAWVAMPSMGAVVGLFLDQPSGEDAGDFQGYLRAGASLLPGVQHIQAVPGSDVDMVSWSFLDRQVQVLSAPELLINRGEPFGVAVDPVRASLAAPASVLPSDVLEGRRLFYSATDTRMAAAGAGVSCETCHTDGRSDGFTWIFDDFPRQTPHLAGRVSDTLPITWTGAVETVVEEVHATTRSRMGGSGLDDTDAAKVAAYVDWTREVVRPAPQGEDEEAAVNRGRSLFQSAEVGCANCHVGATGTDGQVWSVLGFSEGTNTPTLRGIGGSAPYLHDGSSPTLHDLLVRVRDGSMGSTATLTDADLDDLEAYLKTL